MGQPESVKSLLARMICVVEHDTGQQVPINSETLSMCYGLQLTPVSGARFELRENQLIYDPCLPRREQAALIARGAAARILERHGLLGSPLTVGDLAAGLCSVPPKKKR